MIANKQLCKGEKNISFSVQAETFFLRKEQHHKDCSQF